MAKKSVPNFWRHLKLLVVALLAGLIAGPLVAPDLAWSVGNIKVTRGQARKPAVNKSKGAPKKPTKKSVRGSGKKGGAKTRARVEQGPDPEKLPFPENVKTLARSGAVLVTDNHLGQSQSMALFSLNPDKAYVPASILKLVTAGAALDSLGLDFRFQTNFYLDRDQNLWVVGRGDPFLVAEELCLIMDKLKQIGLRQVKDVYLDNSFFQPGLILDGNTFTINPYDAYNLALGVNFNTVNYLIDQKGQIVECDPCSPLTPVTVELAKRNLPKKRKKGRYPREFRLNISSSPQDAELNTGQMFKALLEKFGIPVSGQIVLGQTLPKNVKLIYSHKSSKTLADLIKELLRHSNNFMTNQIFLAMGAEKYGAPATPAKSLRVVLDFLDKYELPTITMVEGSGLSRQNSLTARQMSRILGTLEPIKHLIHASDDGSVIYKTGTMSDIQTLAGYLVRPDRIDEPLSFVILLNGNYRPGTREKILKALKAHFIGPEVELSTNQKSAAAAVPKKSSGPPPKGGGLFAPAESAL
ncbi:MAG: D-alanyl-D-alanine carboxypeptidase [Deltaproteobacteria bacterium]|jgi:D-alanyl-D-alanine carboxypeptidase/D-alanyl-D-alanine-endopeptidase (penicillin-binding protein 4)|nr:D-alanyl-D-alanine carboxypeptidase [Deltaproteobacteria bacterium]